MVIGLKGVRDTQGFDRFDLGCFAASVRHGDEVMGVCEEKNRSRFLNYKGIPLMYMAAAQNVRSGSSPGPTHDPDLRSRPPIQTIRKDLIQTFDPDLWNDIMYW